MKATPGDLLEQLQRLLKASEEVAIVTRHDGSLSAAGQRLRQAQYETRKMLGLPMRDERKTFLHSGVSESDLE